MKKIFVTGVSLFFILTSLLSQRVCGPEFAQYGLEGKSYEEAVDWAGNVHNEYQEYMLNFFLANKPDFKDTNTLKEIIGKKSVDFFNSKGLEFNSTQYPITFGTKLNTEFDFKMEGLSEEASAILLELKSLINPYDPKNDHSFFSRLNELKRNSLMLENDTEVFSVGVSVSVAIHSYQYWKEQGQSWLDKLTDDGEPDVGENEHGPSINIPNWLKKKCNISVGSVAGSDVGEHMPEHLVVLLLDLVVHLPELY